MTHKRMNQAQHWKNFQLGEELDVSGTFIYNGLRRFIELRTLSRSTDLFEIFYQLSIGFERLMKVAIVLLEHDGANNQEDFEKSLLTHNLQKLIARIEQNTKLGIANPERALLHVLTAFYEKLRYDRFSINSPLISEKERISLFRFLEQQLGVEFEERDSMFPQENTEQYKKFIRKIVVKIASELYRLIKDRAFELHLYTYELHSGSKAETIFLRDADIPTEEVLWKELLIFLMNTKETSGYLKFLRSIEPLAFDPGLVCDYLDCFQSDSARSQVVDELSYLYDEEVENVKERLKLMSIIGEPNISFDFDEEE